RSPLRVALFGARLQAILRGGDDPGYKAGPTPFGALRSCGGPQRPVLPPAPQDAGHGIFGTALRQRGFNQPLAGVQGRDVEQHGDHLHHPHAHEVVAPLGLRRDVLRAGAEAQDKRTHHVRSERCPSGSRISSWGLGPARAAILGNKSFQGGAISWRHGVMPRSGGQGQKAASVINCRAQCRSELFERFAARAASYNMYHQGPSRTVL
ncbi:unnamed protein product, partial [Effrenium voratum]